MDVSGQSVSLPPDRSHVPTEGRLAAARGADALATADFLRLMSDQDAAAAAAVNAVIPQIAAFVDDLAPRFERGGRLIYAGAGTSGRLGVLDAAEMPPTYGTDPAMVRGVIAGGCDALVRSQEGAEDYPEDGAAEMDALDVGSDDFVLGIATSGTTPYVHGAVNRARELGARTGFLMCTYPPEELVERLDVVIAPLVGPEVITGSTRMKAGTATKLVLNTITTGAMVRLGKVYGNLMVDLQVTCAKLRDRGERILESMLELDRSEAVELLERAEGHVKTALVMGRLGLDAEDARQRLADASGVIARVMGDGGDVREMEGR